MQNVIDVSSHQGTINFAKLKGNIDGIIIRVSYRTYGKNSKVYIDKKFKRNVEEAIKYQIPIVGFYSYSECLSDQELLDEMDVFFGAIKQYKGCAGTSVFFDYEGYQTKGHRALQSGKANRTKWFLQYYNRAKAEGYTPYLYGSVGNIQAGFYLENIPVDTELWIARYYGGYKKVVSDIQYKPMIKGYDDRIVGWQYTSIGRVSGISGHVDMNFFFSGVSKKTTDQIAEEVIQGLWGNGVDRKNRLKSAGYEYQTIQSLVNQKLRG